MTMEVGWLVEQASGSFTSEHVMLADSDDVSDLVRRLGAPGAGLARLIHGGRPLWEQARCLPDHHVFVAIDDGFGYLSFQDMAHGKRYVVGAPESPGGEYLDDEFPPGSGISVDQLAKAIAEFMHTSEIPTCVAWTTTS
ncbi:Imm1 family immunity protein [Actinokineospora sp.]|uniref:Imm1 family immunity protein n=1 Tax=Actinokineospora sp. TaxID=1872133 RepID=UPI004037EE1D